MTLVWAPGLKGIYDYDAIQYVAAVEAADGQALEYEVACAINDFVVGCKTDGIWDAIKASCILAGARTLSGALVPLAGTAPTNYNFVAGDYNRKTGLAGDGSTKYLDSNRNNNSDPQNSVHQSIWISSPPSSGGARVYIGAGVVDSGTTHIVRGTPGEFATRNRNSSARSTGSSVVTGFAGHSRSASNTYTIRANSVDNPATVTSQIPFNGNVFVFATNPASVYSDARLAFYSIGESLDLALLDNRVTTLMTDIGAAIP